MVEKYCVRCLENKDFGNEWAQCDGEHMPKIILTEKESAGVSKYEGHPLVEVKDGRKLLGASMKDEPGWHNRYSVAVCSLDKDPIFVEVFKDIPEELFPNKNETKESMISKLSQCTFLDVLWNHFPHPGCPLTSWQESKQPARRTMSQVVKMPYTYNSDKPPGEEEGNGEDVVRMFVYPNNECPTNLWPNRPMKNKEMGQLLKVWMAAWPWCTHYTRNHHPNSCQQLFYHSVLGKYMGDHKDNFGPSAIKRLCDGDTPYVEGATVGGCKNSQVIGSSVIIYTRGNRPMNFIFKYASLGKPVTQSRSDYITSPSYQIRMGDGWITVLDPMDDMLMLHTVVFDDDDEGQPDGYRIAYVYRNLHVKKDFYVDTSTIRRDGNMMKTVEKKVQLEGHLRRSIFS
eukprot:scaffold23749_cov72-Cyclotella_meneghiniana.AAC.2